MHLDIATYHVAFFVSGFLRFLSVIYLKKNVKEPGAKSLKNVIKSKIKNHKTYKMHKCPKQNEALGIF